ncbi:MULTISPECIES: core component of ECF transporter [Shewanella]|uniref:core component of ECF transporter n=1 Tax=Shewanella TaxID=22 RepID=UPI001C6587C3|nr:MULTISPECIES: core component of ECF transporter [Shewanella]QYJ75552.1 core component of ECF transporter [Shewanella sp. FJAT-52076]QYK05408.1 core component of ECF transporter [Shewanella zhangzhouensis]
MKTELGLQQALFIGFCAALMIALKSMLRLKLGLSGHSMLLMSFFYLLCHLVVARPGAMLACGLLSGLLAMMLGVGKSGVLLLVKFGAPAAAMELMALILPAIKPGNRMAGLYLRLGMLAFAGALAWGLRDVVGTLLAGMALPAALLAGAMEFAGGFVFALVGAALIPPVIRRLKAHDLIASSEES